MIVEEILEEAEKVADDRNDEVLLRVIEAMEARLRVVEAASPAEKKRLGWTECQHCQYKIQYVLSKLTAHRIVRRLNWSGAEGYCMGYKRSDQEMYRKSDELKEKAKEWRAKMREAECICFQKEFKFQLEAKKLHINF